MALELRFDLNSLSIVSIKRGAPITADNVCLRYLDSANSEIVRLRMTSSSRVNVSRLRLLPRLSRVANKELLYFVAIPIGDNL